MAKALVRDTENLATFEPNSGRGIPKATLKEQERLRAEREGKRPAPKKRGK